MALEASPRGGGSKVAAVKPGFGYRRKGILLEDIALLAAQCDLGALRITLSMHARSERAIVDGVGSKADIKARVQQIGCALHDVASAAGLFVTTEALGRRRW